MNAKLIPICSQNHQTITPNNRNCQPLQHEGTALNTLLKRHVFPLLSLWEACLTQKNNGGAIFPQRCLTTSDFHMTIPLVLLCSPKWRQLTAESTGKSEMYTCSTIRQHEKACSGTVQSKHERLQQQKTMPVCHYN